MARIIAVTNQKGGVGKSTTSINLAAGLAGNDKKVLLVDIDPQGNTTSGVGIEKHELTECVYNVLIEETDAKSVIVKSEFENLYVLPATIQLAGAEIELVSAFSRETRLKKSLNSLRDSYDYIIIDCPPSLGLLTVNALTASDSLIIPLQCEYYALEGLAQLISTVDLVNNNLNPELIIDGVLLTMHDPRTNLSQQIIDEVRNFFPGRVFKTIIPRNIKLSEAPSFGMPIYEYNLKSKGAISYEKLTMEVLAI